MKRTKHHLIEHIGRHYPTFFWYECCMCKKEFRREKGWWAQIYNRWWYLCKECGGEDRELALNKFSEWDKKRRENRPPPPGPMSSKRK